MGPPDVYTTYLGFRDGKGSCTHPCHQHPSKKLSSIDERVEQKEFGELALPRLQGAGQTGEEF